MPKQFNLPIIQFNKGILTEASPLDFPMGASIDESNFTLVPNGNRERRLGLDFEDGFSLVDSGFTKEQLETKNISYHDWPNAMNSPNSYIGIVAIDERLFFFDMNTLSPSSNRLNHGNYISIPMNGTGLVRSTYVNGFLVLTCSAYENPVYLEYDADSDIVSYTPIILKIRDLQGVDDGLPLRERPTTLSLEHKYNLINQGWTNSIETIPDGTSEIQFIEAFRGVGGTSGNVTWGGVTWWQDEHNDDIPIGAVNNKIFRGCKYPATAARVGSQLHITFDPRDGARPQYDFEQGRCLWNGCAIYSGRIQAGTTTSYGDVHSYLRTKLGVYASNCDIVSLGLVPDGDSLYYNKFSIDTFQKNTGYLNLGEAPKGHIIIDAKNRNTSRNSTVPGVASDYDTGSVSVCCGHAGRVFYAGVQGETINPDARTINSHSLVYFTQIITDKTKLERCYQENDPTDQRQFELAAGDGGTIFIPGCANVIALKSYGTSVLVFSEVGIWEITGGQTPFAATSYSVNRVSNISCISPDSILEVNDSFILWAREGIFSLTRNQYGELETENISMNTIQSIFNEIPDDLKRGVKGHFDSVKNQVRWVYTPGEKLDIAVPVPSNPVVPYEKSMIFSLSAKATVTYCVIDENTVIVSPLSAQFTSSPYMYNILDLKNNSIETKRLTTNPDNTGSVYSPMVKLDDDHFIVIWNPTATVINFNCRNFKTNINTHAISFSSLFGVTPYSVSRLHMFSLGNNDFVIFLQGLSGSFSWSSVVFHYDFSTGFSVVRSPQTITFNVNMMMAWRLTENSFLLGDQGVFNQIATWDGTNFTFTTRSISLSTPIPPGGGLNIISYIFQSHSDPMVFYGANAQTYAPFHMVVYRLSIATGSWVIDPTFCQEINMLSLHYNSIVEETDKGIALIIFPTTPDSDSTQGPKITMVNKGGIHYESAPIFERLHQNDVYMIEGADNQGIVSRAYPYNFIFKLNDGRHVFLTVYHRNAYHSYEIPNITIRNFT